MIKVIAMMFVLAVAGTTAATSEFSGTWVGTFNTSGSDHSVPQVLTFNQQGSKLTGSGGPDTVERYPIAKGHVENGQASFELTTSRGITFVYQLRKTGWD